jgi:endonuclease YncB( thermonuclease family)
MHILMALLGLIIGMNTALAQGRNIQPVEYSWSVIRVVDGDTVQFAAPWVPAPIPQRISVRIFGVDTPEKGHRAQCPREAALGQRATEYTTRAVTSASRVTVMLREWDKYGGRVIGDIMVDGTSLRTMLIREGLAREYFGEAKTSWCN